LASAEHLRAEGHELGHGLAVADELQHLATAATPYKVR